MSSYAAHALATKLAARNAVGEIRYQTSITNTTASSATAIFFNLLTNEMRFATPITNAKLRRLAKQYPPPQSWYEEDNDLF